MEMPWYTEDMGNSTGNALNDLELTNDQVVDLLVAAKEKDGLDTANDIRLACKKLFPTMDVERQQACLTLLAERLFSERGSFIVPPIRRRPNP
jgi:hypothetical protein